MTEKKGDSVKETRTVMIPGDESGKKYTVEWAGGGNENGPVFPEDKPKSHAEGMTQAEYDKMSPDEKSAFLHAWLQDACQQ